ncbi:MAG: hypothetical protein SGJ15_00850 [Bacteroidota bacterium]|nr:hypothetical protein [Bacteroidota bacterium]
MTPTENLHYAIGELAYAIASADGEVQKEERKKFQDIVAAEMRCKDYGFDVSDIIFKIMDRDKTATKEAYDSAMKQVRTNSHYLSPELKKTFINVIEKVAKAYSPVTIDENSWIEKFKKDIETLNGDPVYYKQALIK